MHKVTGEQMEDDAIIFSNLNDFIFCPASIYFHNLYGNQSVMAYQSEKQINGSHAHEKIDNNQYTTSKDVITSLEVYSSKYNVVGKIDVYYVSSATIVERKKQIKEIYDGYIFQVYAQYFGMIDAGYPVRKIKMHSLIDNKTYEIKCPEDNPEMLRKFEKVIEDIRRFDMESFVQQNSAKCRNCIYEPACDRSVL